MCGICGVIQLDGLSEQVVAPDVLYRMTDLMTHRGPNDRGVYLAHGVALGMRRLSIVDVEGGQQPVASEDGLIHAIQNGELFNHGDLRPDLTARGHRLASRCDTEVITHLYEERGDDFPVALNGMFAIAVWDERKQRAVLVRDRLGVKPLYYARAGNRLVFASELKSVLASGLVSTELDLESLECFLTLGYVPGPRTLLANVAKLLPGHRLVVERGDVRIEPYWAYPEPQPESGVSLTENAHRVLALLEDSVRMRMMSDVPFGAMLSGGLDSSMIVALMARHTSEPVKTFSVGFTEDDRSELDDARLIARAFSTDHHELELSFSDVTVPIEDLVWSLDEPLADLSSLGFHALSRLAAEHVTVALCGQGSDELYAGYPKHRAASLVGSLSWVPWSLRRFAARTAAGGSSRAARMTRTLAAEDPANRLLVTSGLHPAPRQLLTEAGRTRANGSPALNALRRFQPVTQDPLGAGLHLDAQLALVDDMLHFSDRTSMAHSLEVRVPFLDYRLVEQAARIPTSHKVHRLQTKVVLKLAARGILPDTIIDKAKLGFFAGPVTGWLQLQLQDQVMDYLMDPGARYTEYLSRDAVAELVRRHSLRSGRHESLLLLAIFMFEVWLSTYLPRATAPTKRRDAATGS
jgi:asparagine synthase (glutamine-hydrolysing)